MSLAAELLAFSGKRPGHHAPVVALILLLTVGPRVAAAEAFIELAVGLLLYAVTRAGVKPVWRSAR